MDKKTAALDQIANWIIPFREINGQNYVDLHTVTEIKQVAIEALRKDKPRTK